VVPLEGAEQVGVDRAGDLEPFLALVSLDRLSGARAADAVRNVDGVATRNSPGAVMQTNAWSRSSSVARWLLVGAGALAAWCADTVRAAERAAPRATVHRKLVWTGLGKPHSLDLVSTVSEGACTGIGVPSFGDEILSVVGPMITTYRLHDSFQGDRGTISEFLEVKYLDGYQFDLGRYLDDSHQAGKVAAALLRDARTRRPELARAGRPSLEEVEGWREPFAAVRKKLLEAKCAEEYDVRLEPEAFSIDDFVGESDVDLEIQVYGPQGASSANRMTLVTVRLRAPAEWLPWLRAARDGNGLLARRACDWLVRLPAAVLEKLRPRLAASPARRKIIEDEVARPAGAYQTATELLREYFPWSERPDLETQWAWSDLILYQAILGLSNECVQTARTMYRVPLAPRVAKAAVYNVAGCLADAPRTKEHLACLKQPDPAACSKALLEQRAGP
jgi:hypothetical protein